MHAVSARIFPGLLVLALSVLALPGCDDTIFGSDKTGGGSDSSGSDSGGGSGDDFCAVKRIFNNNCVSCHTVGGAGGLDLETDPYNAIVSVASSLYDGRTLVVPSDSAGSFLYLKTTGGQGSDGGAMPIPSGLSASQSAVIAAWIDAGAVEECGTGTDSGGTDSGGDDTAPPSRYHPVGYDDPILHGDDAKQQRDTCTSCHGADLTGVGDAVSCDSCHVAGWRTNCTFCHGNADDGGTGAPPDDIDGESDPDNMSFSPHTTHVSDTEYKNAFDCEQCHSKPTDILSSGHLFVSDSTPGVAEVDFSGGISSSGDYEGLGTCSNLWCHGNGTGHNGTAEVGDDFDTCMSCHPYNDSPDDDFKVLGGRHEDHMTADLGTDYLDCADCHRQTAADFGVIEYPEYHVDGTVEVSLVSGVTYASGTCTGTCHGETHSYRTWEDGYAAPKGWWETAPSL